MDEHCALLVGDEIRRVDKPTPIPIEPGARALAFTMAGSVLLAYPDRLVRLGEHALAFEVDFELRALATDPGGYWLGGDRLVRGYRPTAGGVTPRAEYTVPSAVRSLAYGPDGSIYALLEDGSVLRDGERRASTDAVGLARAGARLLALTPRGIEELPDVVPPPPEAGLEVELPACDS